jgi:hypothetical protein
VDKPKSIKRQIVYENPSPQLIDQYAHDVCQELGEKIDPSFNTPEMRRELANFLKVVSTVCVKSMNKQNGDSSFS